MLIYVDDISIISFHPILLISLYISLSLNFLLKVLVSYDISFVFN